MQLQLQQLLPVYFDESQRKHFRQWRKDFTFTKGEYMKIVFLSGSGKSSPAGIFCMAW